MDPKKISAAEARVRSATAELAGHTNCGGFCVTMVTGLPWQLALSIFGADYQTSLDPSPPTETDLRSTVALLRGRAGPVIVEFDGQRGADPELLTKLTTGAAAGSVYWKNSDVVLSLAQGNVVEFNAPVAGLPLPSVPNSLRDIFAELDFANPLGCSILAVERFIGERIKPQGMPTTRYPLLSN